MVGQSLLVTYHPLPTHVFVESKIVDQSDVDVSFIFTVVGSVVVRWFLSVIKNVKVILSDELFKILSPFVLIRTPERQPRIRVSSQDQRNAS